MEMSLKANLRMTKSTVLVHTSGLMVHFTQVTGFATRCRAQVHTSGSMDVSTLASGKITI